MDLATLTAFLAPCLPFLVKKVGEPALDGAVSKLGEETWERAKAIWLKLWPKVESDAAAKMAAEKLANKPDSEAWKEALQEELAAILQKDAALTEAIAEILQTKPAGGSSNYIQQRVETNQGQMVGQMVGGIAKNIGKIDSVQGDVNL